MNHPSRRKGARSLEVHVACAAMVAIFFTALPLVASPEWLTPQASHADGSLLRFAVGADQRMQPADVTRAKEAFGLGPLDELRLVETRTAGAVSYEHYQQFHDGIVVPTGRVVLFVEKGLVTGGLADVVEGIALLAPTLDESAVRSRMQGPVLSVDRIVTADGRLAFRVVERAGMEARVVDVDASSGEIVLDWSTTQKAWSPVEVNGTYLADGSPVVHPIVAEREGPGSRVRLRHAPLRISTFRIEGGDPTVFPDQRIDITSTSGDFTDAALFAPFVAVQAGMQAGLGLLTRHGLRPPRQLVALGSTQYTGQLSHSPGYNTEAKIIVFPFESSGHGRVSGRWTQVDALAHETAHAVLHQALSFPGPGLEEDEWIALSEGLADLVGMMAERDFEGDLNWSIGEDGGGVNDLPLRYLDDPARPAHDLFSGARALDPDDRRWAAGDRYQRSGPLARFFYLLSEGGEGTVPPANAPFAVKGIGFDEASELLLTAVRTSAVPTMDYAWLRGATLEIAREGCGEGSELEASVANAWFAVVNGPAATADNVFPTADEEDVEPWPARFRFASHSGEHAWEIDVDEDETFASPEVPPIIAENVSGNIVTATANLRPGRRYFWRVRHAPPGGTALTCASATRSFMTADKRPVLTEPLETDAPLHPWDLLFAWDAEAGAVGYDFEIVDRPRGYRIERALDAGEPVCSLDSCLVIEDLATDSGIVWRVRARGPSEPFTDNMSEFRESGQLATAMPAAEFVAPECDTPQSPWLQVRLDRIPGADHVDVVAVDEKTGTSTGPFAVDLTTFTARVSSPPHFDEDEETFTLEATPVGPLVEPTEGSPFTDEGEAATCVLRNRGSLTIPHVTAPWDSLAAGEPPLINPNEAVRVKWERVDGADGYTLTLYPLIEDGDSFAVVFGQEIFSRDFDADTTTFDLNTIAPRTGDGIYGAWITVRARDDESGSKSPIAHEGPGPPILGDFAGQAGDTLFYWRIPDITIDDRRLIRRGDVVFFEDIDKRSITLELRGQPVIYSPERVRARLYAGRSCEAPPIDEFDIELLGHPASYVLDYTGVGTFGVTRSFQVVAESEYGGVPAQRSGCLDWEFATEAQHRCGNGTRDDGEQCDDGGVADGDGCTSTCQYPALPCGAQPRHAGDVSGFPAQNFALGRNTRATLLWNSLRIPDAISVRQDGVELLPERFRGCQSTNAILECSPTCSIPIEVLSTSDVVTVTVTTDCKAADQAATEWVFQMVCPSEGDNGLGEVSEPP